MVTKCFVNLHAWKISLFIFCNEIWYLTKKEKFHCERWKLHRFCCHTSAALTNRLKGPGSRLVCTKKLRDEEICMQLARLKTPTAVYGGRGHRS